MSLDIVPARLEGEYVVIEPLGQEHANGLFNRGTCAPDWEYLPRPCFVDLADCRHWIDEALENPEHVPFAVVEKSQGRAVGSSRYMQIRPHHRGLEIGYSWLGRDWQGTVVNIEAKLLLLEYALEQLGYLRVELKTDLRNQRSQRAIAGIGAQREGVLRRHMVVQNGHVRDSVYFSVTDQDWPAVKAGLQEKLRVRAAEQGVAPG